jgi:hypothetical protein
MSLREISHEVYYDIIELLREALAKYDEDVLIFTNSDLSVGVFTPTPAMKRRLETIITAPQHSVSNSAKPAQTAPQQPLRDSPQPDQAQQQSLSENASSAASTTTYGSEIDEEDLPSPSKGEQPADVDTESDRTADGLHGEGRADEIVPTKRMRRKKKAAEKREAAKHANSATAKKPPRSRKRTKRGQLSEERVEEDSEGEKADSETANGRKKRKQVDNDATALVHPWFEGRKIGKDLVPRSMQKQIIDKAKSIAGPECVNEWWEIMSLWRKNKVLIMHRTPLSSSPSASQQELQAAPKEFTEFLQAWDGLDTMDVVEAVKQIQWRVRMVQLHQIYCQCETVPWDDEPVPTRGRDGRSIRKRILFDALFPQFKDAGDNLHVSKVPGAKGKWAHFGHRLDGAARWYHIQQELNWGILGLIPHKKVTKTWVETFPIDGFKIWVQAIRYFNCESIVAGEKWSDTINKALKGQQISERRRRIEMLPASVVNEYPATDAQKLFHDGQSGDEGIETYSSQGIRTWESGDSIMELFTRPIGGSWEGNEAVTPQQLATVRATGIAIYGGYEDIRNAGALMSTTEEWDDWNEIGCEDDGFFPPTTSL